MKETNNNINSSYTYNSILSIINDIIGLYLVIKKDNKNRAKLTIKTILMSLVKQDLNTFYKYYDLFKNALFKIQNDKILNNEEINNREVSFALLTQIKLILDSYYNNINNNVNNNLNNNILKDIIEKGFSNLDNQNFYLFQDLNNNFITNINQVEDISQFKLFCFNTVIGCCKELLERYF